MPESQPISLSNVGAHRKVKNVVAGNWGTSDSRFRVRALDEKEFPVWNDFVSQSPQGTLFHTTEWLETTGTPFRVYGCFDDHGLAGGMVLQIVGKRRAGHSCFTGVIDLAEKSRHNVTGYNYSCPYSGVVLAPPSNKYVTSLTRRRHVLQSLINHITPQFTAIYSRMVPELNDVQPFIAAGYQIGLRYTYRIDLRNVDAAWGNMTDKRRNDIRKAQRDGITIEPHGTITDMISLLSDRCQRQKRVLQFSEFAQRRDDMLSKKNHRRCFLARDSAGALAAGIYFAWDNRCAYYLHGSYGVNAKHRGAGSLALWEAIRYAAETLKLEQLDLLPAESGPVEAFAREFGGRLTVAYNVNFERPSVSRDVKRIMGRLKKIVRSR